MHLEVEAIIKQMPTRFFLSKKIALINPQVLLDTALDRAKTLTNQIVEEGTVGGFHHLLSLVTWGQTECLELAEQAIQNFYFSSDKVEAYLKLYLLNPRENNYLSKAYDYSKNLFFVYNKSTHEIVWTPQFVAENLKDRKEELRKNFKALIENKNAGFIIKQNHSEEAITTFQFDLRNVISPLNLFKTVIKLTEAMGQPVEEALDELPHKLFEHSQLYFEAGQMYSHLAKNSFHYFSQAGACGLLLRRQQKFENTYELYKTLIDQPYSITATMLLNAAKSLVAAKQSRFGAHLLALIYDYFQYEEARWELEKIVDQLSFSLQKLQAHAILGKRGNKDSVRYIRQTLHALWRAKDYEHYAYLCRLLKDHPRLSLLTVRGAEKLLQEGKRVQAVSLFLELYQIQNEHVPSQKIYQILLNVPRWGLHPLDEFSLWEKFINDTFHLKPL